MSPNFDRFISAVAFCCLFNAFFLFLANTSPLFDLPSGLHIVIKLCSFHVTICVSISFCYVIYVTTGHYNLPLTILYSQCIDIIRWIQLVQNTSLLCAQITRCLQGSYIHTISILGIQLKLFIHSKCSQEEILITLLMYMIAVNRKNSFDHLLNGQTMIAVLWCCQNVETVHVSSSDKIITKCKW